MPSNLVVLDFSGTLSLEAVLFGRAERLAEALRQSGLARLGVDSPAVYWQEIVNPTWAEGSTTAGGYKRLVFERLVQMGQANESETWAAVSAFVDSYLARSTVDPAWEEPLQRWAARPGLAVVVATDHYAEATASIVAHLAALGVEAVPALQAESAAPILVANSADLGHPKASRAFWQQVEQVHRLPGLERVLIVDDFGFNEQPSDSYAAQQKVMERQEKTVGLLAELFRAETEAFPFFLRGQAGISLAGLRSQYRALVGQAGQFVRRLAGV